MTKPKHFNLNSDFATTQNDSKGTLSYTIPAGTVVGNGSTTVFQATGTVGTINAYNRAQWQTTNAGSRWFSGNTLVTDANVSLSGIGAVTWPLYHTLERTSANTVRIYCELFNNSGSTMTVTTSQTITCEDNTFLSPFPS